ncbi:4Fe-4S binding protein [Candidatus Sumerlaeota bacterium]|nr:4Fe-4S binding protein [Candidatus Sumerlaeota bacterium]
MKKPFGIVVCFLLVSPLVFGIERFPPPDFAPDYVFPSSSQTAPRAAAWMWIDSLALIVALVLATAFALKWRSRKGLVWLSLASLAYFGFFRKGCVCPIGAIQNVSQSLVDPTFAIPLVVVFFFLLPLVFAALFGRVFCSAVCPFGALQELALVRPVRVPSWLDRGLRFLPYVYLGLAVLLAATGASYIICLYDPFVGFFRMSARFHIWVLSIAMLILAMFVGRPYCRYLCPYGVLLAWLSRFSLRRVTITPHECVGCGLCRDACPFGAIREGTRVGAEEKG